MIVLKNVRNFLTHYGEQKALGEEFLWSRELLVINEKVRLFLQVCLFGAMGMMDEEIKSLIDNFYPYKHWCFEASIDWMNEHLKSDENKPKT